MQAIPADIRMRLDIATVIDCPFKGRVREEDTIAVPDRLVKLREAEICLCDMTGRVAPVPADI